MAPSQANRSAALSASSSPLVMQRHTGSSGVKKKCSSQAPAPSAPPIVSQEAKEIEVPWVAALTTYFGYLLLFFFGYFRDFFRSVLPSRFLPRVFTSKVAQGYAPLASDYEDFYTRRLYHRIQDCWNRPIASAPGAWFDVMLRESKDRNKTLHETGETRRCLNLGSYNYLGFAESEPDIVNSVVKSLHTHGAGCCSSRSELGSNSAHAELEVAVATFLNKPAAMVTGMGFATNSTIIPSLCDKGTLIVSDSLNHASIVVGARGSGAKIKVFKHNNPEHLEKVVRDSIAEGQPRTHRPWKKIIIFVEGIYSMEGEMVRLAEVVEVKKKYKCYLYLDEAHSIGAMGGTGRGICEHLNVNTDDVDILMGTFTKSFGAVGGYIAGSQELINYLRAVSPSANYASAMAAPCATQALRVLESLDGKDGTTRGRDKIKSLRRNTLLFRKGLEQMGCQTLGHMDSPVIPMMLYNPSKMPAFSRECLARNLAAVVVGFPATPLIQSRVRFCVSAAHTEEDIIEALKLIDDVSYRVMVKYTTNGSLDIPALKAMTE